MVLSSCTRPDDASDAGAGTVDTGADVDSGGTVPDAESGDESGDPGATGTGEAGQTGGEESGDGPPDVDACEAMPNALPTQFALDMSEFPLPRDPPREEGGDCVSFMSYEATCTVTAVEVGSGLVTTALDCMVDDAPVVTSLTVAAPVTGTPAWSAGEAVVLSMRARLQNAALTAGSAALHRVSDGSLLVGGGSGFGYVSPLTISEAEACAVVEPCTADAPAPLQAFIGEPGGESVLLTGGQHSELPLADGTTMQIDAEWYHSDTSCHGCGQQISAAFRRVTP